MPKVVFKMPPDWETITDLVNSVPEHLVFLRGKLSCHDLSREEVAWETVHILEQGPANPLKIRVPAGRSLDKEGLPHSGMVPGELFIATRRDEGLPHEGVLIRINDAIRVGHTGFLEFLAREAMQSGATHADRIIFWLCPWEGPNPSRQMFHEKLMEYPPAISVEYLQLETMESFVERCEELGFPVLFRDN
jgi:hypothetical protein